MKAGFNSQKQKRRFERETEAFFNLFLEYLLGEWNWQLGRDKKLGSSVSYKYEKVFFWGLYSFDAK